MILQLQTINQLDKSKIVKSTDRLYAVMTRFVCSITGSDST